VVSSADYNLTTTIGESQSINNSCMQKRQRKRRLVNERFTTLVPSAVVNLPIELLALTTKELGNYQKFTFSEVDITRTVGMVILYISLVTALPLLVELQCMLSLD